MIDFHASRVTQLSEPCVDGIFVRMKKTLHIDADLLMEARAATGTSTDTETIRLGLEALVRHAAYERLRSLRGTEPTASDTPRRREKGAHAKKSKRRSAA